MRFTIERLRTLVLAAGILLLVVLVVFLAVGKWRNPFSLKELPKRLGIDIKEEANGYTYAHAFGAHSQFKIHASKVVQLKDNHALLHDVKIEVFGEDGSRVDRIEGSEFEWDQKSGTARAAGPVEITLTRPGVAPAIAPKATPAQAVSEKIRGTLLASAAETAASGQIHVKTSGLTFDEKSGVATTGERVDFSMAQGSGSSMGATYDSQAGRLVLERSVELDTRRGADSVQMHAQHAELERGDLVCRLHEASANFRGGQAAAGDAKILFREDGSAVRLDATRGFALTTAAGNHLIAPVGSMEFDERNRPRRGHLEGGVTMDSTTGNANQSRRLHGTAPTAELEFAAQGRLRRAHLERGVEVRSEEESLSAAGNHARPLRVARTWRSPVADVEFRDVGQQRVEPRTIHGTGGVVIDGESQRGKDAALPSRLAADEVTGEFGPNSSLTTMIGTGHASLDQTTVAGARQSTSGDRLEAHFQSGTKGGPDGTAEIQSAVINGHVVLTSEPAAKPGTPAEPPMRATAGRATYEGAGEWLHLTLNPRVEDGSLQLTADKIDVSQESGDAFAQGNVKATWFDTGGAKPGQGAAAFGGQGPAHVVASEAQLHRAGGEATFRGHARLWQQANSIAGPMIVLNRQKQTLVSRSTDPSDPVLAILVTAGGREPGSTLGRDAAGKSAAPSVIRVRGGDLKYSDAEHKATMQGGALRTVTAEIRNASTASDSLELTLLPRGNHAGRDGGQAQVDRMTARGHVVVNSLGRRGTGEQLVYTSEDGEYTLTGTSAAPPRMTDPARGIVIGDALIFHSRDDSVSIEGGGRKTTTETTAPR